MFPRSLITSSTNGYDGSLMNSVESLKLWNDYFDHPHGSKLGLLNAIQVCPLFSAQFTKLNSLRRTSGRSLPIPSHHIPPMVSAVSSPSGWVRPSCWQVSPFRPQQPTSTCSTPLGKLPAPRLIASGSSPSHEGSSSASVSRSQQTRHRCWSPRSRIHHTVRS